MLPCEQDVMEITFCLVCLRSLLFAIPFRYSYMIILYVAFIPGRILSICIRNRQKELTFGLVSPFGCGLVWAGNGNVRLGYVRVGYVRVGQVA